MKFIQKIKTEKVLINKFDYLINFCSKGIKVLHVGCVDSGLLDERLNAGNHLHLMLRDQFGEENLYGIDIDTAGINKLKEMGVRNISVENIEKFETNQKYDLIIAGEVFEHLDNVGNFLHKIYDLLNANGKAIITTPNAYHYWVLLGYLFRREFIHPDHTNLNSYSSVMQVLQRYQFNNIKCKYYAQKMNFNNPQDDAMKKILKAILMMFDYPIYFISRNLLPQFSSTLIIELEK